ncbi:uncharacterized protein PADG_00118 [Paracoccidioides brasiliensis Pb18]|uniref:Uncharacterized protein n=1 Tax=Paracoccidioides brasiliensis (strain Pb18) TaxID=502780 RepID=C1FZS8_PARBD|nr:uncharacterized protein PADG_00118 [Paracoccidioides brasiliensis Pb18]EEH43829.2 hypothetical protein PADG_00118 [Paracoccidioides brasiliensis Pb18]
MLYGKQSGVFESRDLDEVFSFRVLDENVVIHAQGVILGQKVIVAKYRAAAVQADGNNEIDHDEFLMCTSEEQGGLPDILLCICIHGFMRLMPEIRRSRIDHPQSLRKCTRVPRAVGRRTTRWGRLGRSIWRSG